LVAAKTITADVVKATSGIHVASLAIEIARTPRIDHGAGANPMAISNIHRNTSI